MQAVDGIDLAGLGRAGDADRHQDGAGFGLRLTCAAFEIGQIETAFDIDKRRWRIDLRQCRRVAGFAEGDAVVAIFEQIEHDQGANQALEDAWTVAAWCSSIPRSARC